MYDGGVTDEERLLSHSVAEAGCRVFTGPRTPGGYGKIRFRMKQWMAHRMAYELWVGPIPPKQLVLHSCDTPACITPEHLFLGSHQDNMDDCVKKGRQAKGERMAAARLTEAQVREIRQRFVRTSPRRSNAIALAREFGVSKNTIGFVVHRQRWTHV